MTVHSVGAVPAGKFAVHAGWTERLAEWIAPRALNRQIICAIAIFVASYVGRVLFTTAGIAPAVLWMPPGIAVALVFLWGYAMLPAVFLASIAAAALAGMITAPALVFSLSFLVEVAVIVYALRSMRFDPALSRTVDVLLIILVPALLTIWAPLMHLGISYLFAPFPQTPFVTRWVGEAVSVIVFTPLLLMWMARPLPTLSSAQRFETAAAFAALVATIAFLFWRHDNIAFGVEALYAQLGVFLWIALRMGMLRITTALSLVTMFGVVGLIFGGAVAGSNTTLGVRIVSTENYALMLAGIFYISASLAEQQRENMLKLRAAFARLQAEDHNKSEFIAILTHELRNPLAPILTSAEVLRRVAPQSARIRDSIDTIERNAAGMGRILDDMLDIARLINDKESFRLQLSVIALREVIDRATRSSKRRREARRHRLTINLPREELWVEGDALRLEQVMVNLLNNAIKYTDPGGAIAVSARRNGPTAVVEVRDNGRGIPPEQLDQIFGSFVSIADDTHWQEGMGIGLSISRRLTELHRGTLVAESAGLGQGSTFTLRLPLAPPPHPALVPARRAKEKPHPARRAPRHVLVVDDNRSAARSMAMLLGLAKYTVDIAYDGKSALKAIALHRPFAVISDIGLPDMSGYDLAQAIRAQHPSLLLIALSGFGQSEDKRKAIDAGFDHHFSKPASIVEIEKVLVGQAYEVTSGANGG